MKPAPLSRSPKEHWVIWCYLRRKTKASEDIVKGLGEAHEQVIYLAKMINDLSALSRAERGAGLEQQGIDVNDFAHSLYQEYSPQAKNAGLTMDLDIAGKIGELHTSKLYIEEILQKPHNKCYQIYIQRLSYFESS